MQTIIQHVMRGYGPPTTPPVEFGIHYIDVTSGDMYLSRGKTDVADWGQPLKAAMVDGEEGKTFGWNDGQTWYVLDVGVQKEIIDQKDLVIGEQLDLHVDSEVIRIDPTDQTTTKSKDGNVTTQLQAYTTDQLNWIEGFPAGGEANAVMAKLSDADRDAHWLAVSEGDVLQADVELEKNNIISEATTEANIKNSVQMGGSHDQILVGLNNWTNKPIHLPAPTFVYPTDGATTPSILTISTSEYLPIYSENELIYREFDVNGDVYQTSDSSLQLSLVPDTNYVVKVRDITNLGTSKWNQVSFNTSTVSISVVLNTGSANGIVKDPITLQVARIVSGDVDDHIATDWVIKQCDVVIWSSLDDAVNRMSISVPEGLLVQPNAYRVEVRTRGVKYGWSEWIGEDVTAGKPFNGLAVPHDASPYITIYSQDQNTFTKLTNPNVLPTNVACGCSFSPDGNYLAVAHDGSPFVTIYSRSGYTFTKIANPNVLPTSTGLGCSFSPDGNYLAVAHYSSPYITIYSRSGNEFTKLANPSVLPAGAGRGCSFSPDGNYLAVAHYSSPYITIYSRSGSTFTKLANPNVLPTGSGFGCSFSPDGNYLAVAHGTSPYITIYSRSGNTFTKSNNPNVLPTGAGYGCSFSPDGNYLAVAHVSSPNITIYSRSGDAFTKLANPDVLPPSFGLGCSFSPDGNYLAVAHNTSPFITIYSRSGNTFTKLANPDVLPTGNGQHSVAWYYETLPVIGSRATR